MTKDKILMTAQYVEGDLNETETVAFEKLLIEDEELKQHLIDYYEIHNSLQMELGNDANRDSLLKTLHGLNKQYFKPEEVAPKVVKLGFYLKWAASVAAVLIVGLFIWAPWQDDLYQQFNEPSQMTVAERGADKTELDDAAALFNDKKYDAAKVMLAKLNQADPENAMVTYYYSVSLLETNEIAKARALLETLFKGESVFRYDAAYAIAMSYLKEDKQAEASVWLLKIPEGTTQFVKAQALLKKLNKN